jgi:transcriptional regulator with AAA-type ATPase domain
MIKNIKHLHGVYSIVPDEGGHDLWVEIGFATQHADGRGFDLTLRALPLDSKLVLREPADENPKTGFQERAGPSLARQVRDFERAAIKQCLLETGGNVGAALKRLKIPRRTLSEKMSRLGIDRRRLARRSLRTNIDKADRAPQGTERGDGDPNTDGPMKSKGRHGE